MSESSSQRLLLHVCCAACTHIALSELSQLTKATITLYFYGPNIHGQRELEQRKADLTDLAVQSGIDLMVPPHNIREYFDVVLPLETESSVQYDSDLSRRARKRCSRCYLLQLVTTAQAADREGFDQFSSSLFVSPYQNRDELLAIGQTVSQTSQVEFIPFDGRKWSFAGKQYARVHHYHLPDHCACTYSAAEAEAPKLH